MSREMSRESSPEYQDADDGDATLEAAARTRLPTGSLSPEKRRSPSPDPFPSGGKDFGSTFGEVKQEEVQVRTQIFVRFPARASTSKPPILVHF